MLMTKYIYLVHVGSNGYLHSVVTRLSDGAQKYFFQRGGSKVGMDKFFDSMTDELCDGYWPKKASGVDNWAFLGFNIDRNVAQARAEIEYKLRLRVEEVRKHFGWTVDKTAD